MTAVLTTTIAMLSVDAAVFIRVDGIPEGQVAQPGFPSTDGWFEAT